MRARKQMEEEEEKKRDSKKKKRSVREVVSCVSAEKRAMNAGPGVRASTVV